MDKKQRDAIQARHDEVAKLLKGNFYEIGMSVGKTTLTDTQHDRGLLLKDNTRLQAQLERECIWTRVNNSYHCWDGCDAWSTSCGEDYAIEEEWDDKVPNFCNNCGGKAKQALESDTAAPRLK